MNKNDIRQNFQDGDVPTGAEFSEWIERCLISVDSLSELPEADELFAGSCYLIAGSSIYRCEQINNLWQWVLKSQNGNGVSSYLDLTNKPRLNNVVISGEKTLDEFGIMPDFSIIKNTSILKDNYKIIVGIEKNAVRYITVSDLRAFMGIDSGGSTTQIVKERKVLKVSGEQNEKNRIFTAAETFEADSSALYLNGQRLSSDIDYREVDTQSFEFLELAPKHTDRILFEAVLLQ